MNEDSSKKEINYKLLDASTGKKSVLLLVRDSVRPYVQDYLSKIPGVDEQVQITYPSEGHKLENLLEDGCDVAVVDPLAYTGVNKMSDLVAKVAAHTRKGLILVRRNLPYTVPDSRIYREVCDSSVKPAELAHMAYEILSRAVKQPELHSKYA